MADILRQEDEVLRIAQHELKPAIEAAGEVHQSLIRAGLAQTRRFYRNNLYLAQRSTYNLASVIDQQCLGDAEVGLDKDFGPNDREEWPPFDPDAPFPEEDEFVDFPPPEREDDVYPFDDESDL